MSSKETQSTSAAANQEAPVITTTPSSFMAGCMPVRQSACLLTAIHADLVQLSEPEAMMQAVSEKISTYFNLSSLALFSINTVSDKMVGLYSHENAKPPGKPRPFRLSEYLTETCVARLQEGNLITINDVNNTWSGECSAMIEVQSKILVPYIRDGCWKYLLVAQRHQYTWQLEELKLLSDLAERLFQSLERAEATVALHQSEEWLRLAIEATNVYTWSIDLATHEIRASKNAEEIKGFPVPRSLEQLLDSIHEADRIALSEKLSRVMEGSELFEFEYRQNNPFTGDVAWFRAEGRLVRVNGMAARLMGVTQNITARIREKELLAAELDAMTRLHELSTRMVAYGDLTSLLQEAMDAALHITAADMGTLQILDQNSNKLIVVAHCGFNSSYLEAFAEIDTTYNTTCAEVLRQGKRVWEEDILAGNYFNDPDARRLIQESGAVSVQSTPLLTRAGRLVGVINTYWREQKQPSERILRLIDLLARQTADMIDRKQAEEALRDSEERYRALAGELRVADQRKNEFLAILSHEIRNPLASIMLCLSLLDRSAPGSEQYLQTREILGRQAAQLSRLVDDLLDVTRITRDKIVLQKERVEINQLVHRTVQDYQAMFQEKGVVLNVLPSPEALYMEADPARLSQVVGNLLHNAAKFTDSGGFTRVTVARDEAEQCAVISVEDNGIGMSEAMLPNLFQIFSQADPSLDRGGGGGLGLGLALVKGLTMLHGGSVSAHSDGPGKGSRFTIRLPLSGKTCDHPESEAGAAGPVRSRRVLVIEDTRDVAELLKSLLLEEGHEVEVAYSGSEGIQLAREYRPDVLLCDIGLPGMGGYEVARAFRADEELKNVYLVSLTGYARPEDLQKAKEAGFDRQLNKPVQLAELKEALA